MGMRGITVAVRFEHGGYRWNAAACCLTARRRPAILCVKASQKDLSAPGAEMTNSLSVLAGTLISLVSFTSIALVAAGLRHPEHGCAARGQHHRQGGTVLHRHGGSRFQDGAADARSLEPQLSARDRAARRNAAAAGAEGNFIIGPTHNPAPETIAKEGVPRGTTKSFTLSSKESTIYNPGLIRDDVAGCTNSSIMTTVDCAGRQVAHDRHHQPSRNLVAHHRRLCAGAICARHRGAVHRGRRRRLQRLQGSRHDAR